MAYEKLHALATPNSVCDLFIIGYIQQFNQLCVRIPVIKYYALPRGREKARSPFFPTPKC